MESTGARHGAGRSRLGGGHGLLERDDVLAELVELVDRARGGDGQVALVRGEAGIGKTAVAKALSAAVRRDAHVVWGACDDLLAARPLGPIWDMAASDPGLDDALRAGDQSLVRQALLELFTRTHRPTVAVVEDVHWADGATLDLLTLVGRRIERSHTLLVLTFREPVSPDHPLGVVLGDLPAAGVDSFRLRPLSRRAVTDLADDPDVGAQVVEQTGGNPFLVTALLASPDERVPASVGDLMGSLVGRLTGKGERLVQFVSVVPGRVELALLDQTDPDLVGSFAATEQLGLLRMEGQAVTFRHELARTAVEEALDEPLRRALHRQVLVAGEQLGFELARLAHHARKSHDIEAMVRWLPDAAEQAAAGYSHRESVTHLAALEPHLHLLPLARQADLHELRATEELVTSGGGLQHAIAAVDLRRDLGDSSGVGAGLLVAARAMWGGSGAEERARAFDLAHEAVAVLDEVGGEELAFAYGELARMSMYECDPASARHHAEQALKLAPDPSRGRVLALGWAGVVENGESYPDGSGMLEEAAAIAGSLGLAWEEQRAQRLLIESAYEAKDLDHARHLNDLVLAALDADFVPTTWHVITGAVIDTASGDYAAADSTLRGLAERDDLRRGTWWHVEPALAELKVRTGDPKAEAVVAQLRARAERYGHGHDRVWAAHLSALQLWAFRQRDDAATATNVTVLHDTVDWGSQWDFGGLALWLWLDGHVDAIPDGAPDPVRWLGDGDWERAADWFGDRGVPFEQAVALSLGDAKARLEALRIAQRIGARSLAARFRHDLRTDGVTGIPRGAREATRQSPLGLTPRQDEVLDLLADGLSNADIAKRLFISVRTVEHHVSAILATLDVSSRDEAATIVNARDQAWLALHHSPGG